MLLRMWKRVYQWEGKGGEIKKHNSIYMHSSNPSHFDTLLANDAPHCLSRHSVMIS